MFHICGNAFLTLIFNGTTCGWIVEKIGLISNTEIKKNFKIKFLKDVKAEGLKEKESLGANSYFDMVEWNGVE